MDATRYCLVAHDARHIVETTFVVCIVVGPVLVLLRRTIISLVVYAVLVICCRRLGKLFTNL